MSWNRFWSVWVARNREFFRDRAALAWNFLFPFLIVAGFSFAFKEDRMGALKVGVLGNSNAPVKTVEKLKGFEAFSQLKFVEWVSVESREKGENLVEHHRVDMLLDPSSPKVWVSSQSPKGQMAQRLLEWSFAREKGDPLAQPGAPGVDTLEGKSISYMEWLFPGILGMNMMFSALFGVGYVVVRYRKNGVLRRLKATPLTALEFLSAQIISRMTIILFTLLVVFAGVAVLFRFHCHGSYLTLFLVYALGGLSMVSMAMVVSSRTASEEFAGGILNLVSWPMMFLSEVWFSLEGAEPWVQTAAKIFPLSHVNLAARAVMNDGAGLGEVMPHLIYLAVITVVSLTAGASLFRWERP